MRRRALGIGDSKAMNLDFTMTAMCRPEIVARTLASFSDMLCGVKMRNQTLHLNIDPLPTGRDVNGVLLVASMYFASVQFHTPPKPSFPAAVKWCWSQSATPYFFHLEDDWILKQSVYIDALFEQFTDHPELSCVNLRAYNFNEDDPRICLSPCLLRADHARVMAERMSLTANPEKQLRPIGPDNPEGGKHGKYISKTIPVERVIEDIGRPWLERSGCQKNSDEPGWTAWEGKS